MYLWNRNFITKNRNTEYGAVADCRLGPVGEPPVAAGRKTVHPQGKTESNVARILPHRLHKGFHDNSRGRRNRDTRSPGQSQRGDLCRGERAQHRHTQHAQKCGDRQWRKQTWSGTTPTVHISRECQRALKENVARDQQRSNT